MKGCKQAQGSLEYGEEISPCRYTICTLRNSRRCAGDGGIGNRRLHPFDVPVAEVTPEEVIDDVCSFVEAKICERIINALRRSRARREKIQRSARGTSPPAE